MTFFINEQVPSNTPFLTLFTLFQVTLLLASKLPNNNYTTRRTVSGTLCSSRERLQSIGHFIMVILHSVAHISVDEMTDDANPVFLRQFYRVGALGIVMLPLQ